MKSLESPHPSHPMSRWEETIVTILSTPRFGQVRRCTKCKAEQARTVAGSAMNDELRTECPERRLAKTQDRILGLLILKYGLTLKEAEKEYKKGLRK